jgi:cytochrome c oxidase subunit 3
MKSELTMREQNQKMHPHKFLLWIAIGSITMMFAGFTSAYIVKSNMAGWQPIQMPKLFYWSTFVILLSSGTIHLSQQAFRQRKMNLYRQLITATALLGIAFVTLQITGFISMQNQPEPITLKDSVAGSFFYIIAGVHGLHMVGGVIALLVIFFRAFSSTRRYYSSTPIEVAAIYWHFVDLLWIYLFVFFLLVS